MLCRLPATRAEELLVGYETGDDAGVYRLTPDLALIQTVDFFTPVVDDPYTYGAIAAANSLSDVYAMGGRPLLALNIVCYPCHGDLEVLSEILRGGAAKVAEAGALLVGGHTVQDEEPKYGLAVTGTVHPDRLVTNAGARPGDALILTKPLGTGIITTAIKGGLASPDLIEIACATMATLNRSAAEAMQEVGVHACTDITGFGLIGHALEMARASEVTLYLEADRVPLLPEVRELASAGCIPGGTFSNRVYFQPEVAVQKDLTEEEQLIFFDAQTSGGLLIAVPPERADALLRQLNQRGVGEAALIGEVKPLSAEGCRIYLG